MNNNQTGLNLELEAINDELTYIFQTLKQRPVISTEDISPSKYPFQDKEHLQINENAIFVGGPATNIIVPAFTTADVQIKYYDLENREYTNVYKINSLYVGLYDIDKREPINDNSYEIFKLNKNISYSIDFYYLYTDKVKNISSYILYDGPTLGHNTVYIGTKVPKQTGLKPYIINDKDFLGYGEYSNVYFAEYKDNNSPRYTYITKINDVSYQLSEIPGKSNKCSYYYGIQFDKNNINIKVGFEEDTNNSYSYYSIACDLTDNNSYYNFSYDYENGIYLHTKIIFGYTSLSSDYEYKFSYTINHKLAQYICLYSEITVDKNTSYQFKRLPISNDINTPYYLWNTYSSPKTYVQSLKPFSYEINTCNLVNNKFTYEIYGEKIGYTWTGTYIYGPQRIWELPTAHINYTYINKFGDTTEYTNSNVLSFNNLYYGITLNNPNARLVEVYEQTVFDRENSYIITDNIEVSIEKPDQKTFKLTNDIIKTETGNFIYKEPEYAYYLTQEDVVIHSYILAYFLDNGSKLWETNQKYKYDSTSYTYVDKVSYVLGNVVKPKIKFNKRILTEGWWGKEISCTKDPLLTISYTYLSNDDFIDDIKIVPNNKEQILSYKIYPKITYYDYSTSYETVIKLGYYSYNNVFVEYNGDYTEINGLCYGFVHHTTNKQDPFDSSKSETVTYNELIQLKKKIFIDSNKTVKEFIYQDDHIENNVVSYTYPFVISNEVIPSIKCCYEWLPEYTYIYSLNPTTNKYEAKRVCISYAYNTYTYDFNKVPFITDSYVHINDKLEISGIDDISYKLSLLANNSSYSNSELTTSLSYLQNDISDLLHNLNISIVSSNNRISYDLSYSLDNLSYITLNSLTESNEIFNVKTTHLTNVLDNRLNSLTEVIKEYGDNNKSNIIELKESTYSSLTSLSNIISDNLKTLNSNNTLIGDKISNTLDSNLETVDGSLRFIAYSIDNSSLASLANNTIEITKVGYTYEIPTTYNKFKTYSIPGSIVAGKKIETIYTYSYECAYYTDPTSQTFELSNNVSGTADLSKKIGFHVENKQISIAYNSYVYDINEMTYLGIADILYRMSRKIPTKQEFIINTAKDLFVSGEYLLGYTSVNEYAKKAIYRAKVLWDELEKANYIDKEEQPNYLDYINKLN